MLKRAAKIIISGALLLYVIYSTDLWRAQGLSRLADAFANAHWGYLLLALAYIVLIDFISSIKWFCLSRAISLNNGLLELFRYYLICRFFNLFLPSNIGGDLIRVRLQGEKQGQYAQSAAVIFLERMTGLITLVVAAFIASVLMPSTIKINGLSIALGFSIAAIMGLLYLAAGPYPLRLLRSRVETRFASTAKLFNKLDKFHHSLLLFRHHPQSLLLAFANSLLFYLFAIGNVWISARVFASHIAFYDMMIAVPLIMLMMNLPISIGGIGLMEFAYTLILGAIGIPVEIALSTALLMRLKTLLSAALGYLLYSLSR